MHFIVWGNNVEGAVGQIEKNCCAAVYFLVNYYLVDSLGGGRRANHNIIVICIYHFFYYLDIIVLAIRDKSGTSPCLSIIITEDRAY